MHASSAPQPEGYHRSDVAVGEAGAKTACDPKAAAHAVAFALPGGASIQGHRLRAGVLSLACVVLTIAGAPATARGQGAPVSAGVTVVPPSGAPSSAPVPTGSVSVSLDGRELARLSLDGGVTAPLRRATPLLKVTASLLGREVTVRYLGDANYEASDATTVTFPAPGGVQITVTPRDSRAPTIELLSPGDGVRYGRGEEVVAIYGCADPDARSAVTRCEGTVPAGRPVDTSRPGTHAFTVESEDAVGNASSLTVSYTVADSASTGSPPPSAAPPPAAPSAPAPSSGAVSPVDGLAPASVAAIGAAAIEAAPPSGPGGTPATGAPGQAGAGADPEDVVEANAPELGAATAPSAPYDPRSEPEKAIGVMVAAFALLQLGAGRGGLALASRSGAGAGRARRGRAGRRRADRARSGGGDESGGPASDSGGVVYESVDVAFLGAGLGAVALGDRSRTWGWPGTRVVDRLGATVPARLAPRTPLLARVLADGTYLRAVLGSASLVTIVAGFALGGVALGDTGGDAIPPAAWLAIAIAVLGVLDAAAGLAAGLTFLGGTLALGGVDSGADLRLMLGLAALWCVMPILAGAMRPLRRAPTVGLDQSWERATDFVLASLVGAWAVQNIVLSLPGLAGVELAIADHADTAAYCVLAALLARLGLETIAAFHYPRRLDVTEPPDLADPGAAQQLAACALRAALFVFFAYVVAGFGWQLWVAAALFVVPQALGVFADRFPNFEALYRVLPKGLVETVLMLVVGSAVGLLLVSLMNEDSDSFLADSIVLLAMPGFVLSLVRLFGRDGDEPRIGWLKRLGGVALLVLGILVALGVVLAA